MLRTFLILASLGWAVPAAPAAAAILDGSGGPGGGTVFIPRPNPATNLSTGRSGTPWRFVITDRSVGPATGDVVADAIEIDGLPNDEEASWVMLPAGDLIDYGGATSLRFEQSFELRAFQLPGASLVGDWALFQTLYDPGSVFTLTLNGHVLASDSNDRTLLVNSFAALPTMFVEGTNRLAVVFATTSDYDLALAYASSATRVQATLRAPVPEPSVAGLLLLGALGIVLRRTCLGR